MPKGFGPHPPTTSYIDATLVTPVDVTPLVDGPCRALWTTTAGNVSFITLGGTTVSLLSVAAHVELPFACTHVRLTGTTAAILALY